MSKEATSKQSLNDRLFILANSNSNKNQKRWIREARASAEKLVETDKNYRLTREHVTSEYNKPLDAAQIVMSVFAGISGAGYSIMYQNNETFKAFAEEVMRNNEALVGIVIIALTIMLGIGRAVYISIEPGINASDLEAELEPIESNLENVKHNLEVILRRLGYEGEIRVNELKHLLERERFNLG